VCARRGPHTAGAQCGAGAQETGPRRARPQASSDSRRIRLSACGEEEQSLSLSSRQGETRIRSPFGSKIRNSRDCFTISLERNPLVSSLISLCTVLYL